MATGSTWRRRWWASACPAGCATGSDCRSRAFPPLEHRLALDPMVGSASPYRFEPPKGR